jgi:cytoskeletal protein RodZ
MTTRDQVRRRAATGTEAVRGGVALDTTPSLPERLFAARERKGVDLYRAERDTKIRARYLAALERGDYKELPGAVYTKGFLRNYALYLGLDPDEVLLQWRRERSDVKEQEQPVIVVPRPIVTPRKGLTFSPTVVVAAMLTFAIIAFGAYLGVQLTRFAQPPTIAVTEPRTAVIDVDESTTSYVIRGTSIPGATISIMSPGREQPYRVSADADGNWSAEVDLRRGRNQFEISATDPETRKVSETSARLFITVPFLVIEAPTLTVDQPSEGATFENGAIPVQGTTTNAQEVVVSARYTGPTDSELIAGAASPAPPPEPEPVTVSVGEDGAFSTPFELTTGRWALTVTASSPEGKTASLTRNVSVAFEGVNLSVTVRGGRAWLKVWVDGKLDPKLGAAGAVIGSGRTLTFSGKESIEVRTGSSGVTYFTLNGTSLGALGRSGIPETWLFKPPDPPTRTQRR